MKVLLTRRQADSERTAEKLRAAGFEPVIMPLFEIEATGSMQYDAQADFLIFTSAAAVENAKWNGDENTFHNLPAYCVGPKTRAALENKGYKNIRQGRGTAADLANLIEKENREKPENDSTDGPIRGLYICGEVRAYDFGRRFSGSDISLSLREVYRIRQIPVPPDIIRQTIKALKGGIIMVFSPNGADMLLRDAAIPETENDLGQCHILAISENCAERFPEYLQHKVIVAGQPNEAAMIATATAISETAGKSVY